MLALRHWFHPYLRALSQDPLRTGMLSAVPCKLARLYSLMLKSVKTLRARIFMFQ